MRSTHALYIWRKNNGLTQADVCALIRERFDGYKVTPSHLSEIERGNNGPSLVLASHLSAVTGLDMREFVRLEAAE